MTGSQCLSFVCHQSVSDPGDGFDQGRITQFLPQSANVYIESAGVAKVVHAPDSIQEHLTRQYPTLIARQLGQQSELFSRHSHFTILIAHLKLGWIDSQHAIVEGRALDLNTFRSPECRVDPRNQLAHAER